MNAVLDGFKSLGAARLAALGFVGFAMLAMLGMLALRGGGHDRMALLYADLDLREAGQMSEQLERARIPHQTNGAGTELLVPEDQVSAARLLLAKAGLPSGGSIGYELFDRGDNLTASQFQQQLNQTRALEGELARTIRSINGIRGARVHLVLPRREPFARERQEAQASVVLAFAGANRLDREGVQAVVNLVAAAVPGLKPGHIAIIDNRGDLLARAGEPSGPAGIAQSTEQIRQATEQRLSRAVEEMLERSLGVGKVRAETAIQMDFDQVRETQEKFDPDGQVVRSTQTDTNNSKSTEANPSVSVQNNLPNADAGNAASGSQEQKQQETTNYEIGKTVRTMVREQPQIRRISLAVLVDSREVRAADGKATWQERSPEELARITKLVRSAIGFDEKRGDTVEVVNMRFADEAVGDDAAARGPFGLALDKSDLMRLAQMLLIGVLGLLGLLLVFRPMVLRLTAPSADMAALPDGLAAAGAVEGGAGGVAAIAGPGGAGAARIAGPAGAGGGGFVGIGGGEDSMISLLNVDGQLRASSMRRIAELVDKHPEESLAIVRTWMQEEPA